MPIKVLIIDDSQIVRKVLKEELDQDPGIQVVGTAMDPIDASDKIETLHPDVLTLDLELPKMDGLTFLRSLMRHHPLPVVVVSAYTTKGSRLAMEALESGAVEIVPKPGMGVHMKDMTAELITKIKGAAQAKFQSARTATTPPATTRAGAPEAVRATRPPPGGFEAPQTILPPLVKPPAPEQVIAIGSSTGGTQALQYLLSRLPANMPPILIVQHMPPGFTKTFSERLNATSNLEVKEAEQNDKVYPGRVLVAPGGFHMVLRRRLGTYSVEINNGPKVCRQRPAVEVLFESVATVAGKHAFGVILTGMGNDGAAAMLKMKQAGAFNIAQDEKSCVVFGMPKEAIATGGVDKIVHLHRIPDTLHALF